MKQKKILTVSSVKSDSNCDIPLIRICGKQLLNYGFFDGDKLLVELSDSRIVIKKIHFIE
ncbi:MAG: hypothetical protein IJI42_02100 [Methanobrevibacter sp.]|nr:hypothetical protein [Methanobrevibacter sp.]